MPTDAPGSPAHPLRIAIVGSGPSGFYAADALQSTRGLTVHIDMFDRLPTPFGLVRGGVAPDHQKIKSVTKVYDRIAAQPGFAFYGHVTFGEALHVDDLAHHYHATIFATGAQTDRRLGVPGEDLPGSYAATDFVAWYNAHPDYRHLTFDLSAERAVVVGNGNVAMDVARILASTPKELARTDIADDALEALRASRVREIVMLGRRGPAQAAYTNPELKELGALEDANVIVPPGEADLDPLSQDALLAHLDRTAEKNLQTLMQYANATPNPAKRKRVVMRFLVSPTEIVGDGHVEGVTLVRNLLTRADNGDLRPRPTDQFETLSCGLVLRSIGYRGVALPGLPFDERAGVLPNNEGRLLDAPNGAPVPGLYAVGWIKRGPSGVIGTNKPDAQQTVRHLLEDLAAGRLNTPVAPQRAAVDALLASRGAQPVSYPDWQHLDAYELALGAAQARPRVKLSDPDAMLNVIAEARAAQPSGD